MKKIGLGQTYLGIKHVLPWHCVSVCVCLYAYPRSDMQHQF